MNIRERENLLFERWCKKYSEASFMIDGCPNPKIYEHESRKIIFVLKDGNMGESAQSGAVYDQRNELEHNPHPWWGVIARWCFFMRFPTSSWKDGLGAIDSTDAIKDALSRHCFIQLKKLGVWGLSQTMIWTALCRMIEMKFWSNCLYIRQILLLPVETATT